MNEFEFTDSTATSRLEEWGVASQLWSALGWAEKGLVSLGMGNKLPVWTGPCSAAVDW